MGCHTWAARKVDRTIEEARSLWIAKREQWIIDWQEYIDNPDKRPFSDMSLEDKDRHMRVYKRQLQMVKKGLCDLAVMNDQPERLSYFIANKGFYINCDDFHDMFRVGGYPADKCFSIQETLSFIKKYEIENSTTVELFINPKTNQTYLQAFWDKYPDGYIHFG